MIDKYENTNPAEGEDRITSNLIPLEIPATIWSGETEIKDPKDTDIKFRKAPYILKEGRLFSLQPFNRENILLELVDESTVKKHLVSEMISEDRHSRYLTYLLNIWINKLLRAKNLKRDKRTGSYYFVGDRNLTMTWHSGKRTSRRHKVNFITKEDGTVYYVINQAVNAFARIIDEKVYLILLPRLLITENGFQCKSGDATKKILDSVSRDPTKFYNNRKRLDILFWYNFITGKKEEKAPLSKYFDKTSGYSEKRKMIAKLREMVRIGKPLNFKIMWKPNTEQETEEEVEELEKADEKEFDWYADYFDGRNY